MFDSVKKVVREIERRRAVLRPREVVSLEVAQRRAVGVVVELLQQQDVGPHALDDLRHRARLRVVGRGEIAAQRAVAGAIETAIEGGDADQAGRSVRRGGGHQARRREDQQCEDAAHVRRAAFRSRSAIERRSTVRGRADASRSRHRTVPHAPCPS